MTSYLINIAVFVGLNVILGMSFQLALGFGGIPSLAHPAFYGIGAYIAGWLSLQGSPFLVSLTGGAAAAFWTGYLLFLPLRTLRNDYVAIATLAFASAAHAVAVNVSSTLTGGPLGIAGIPRPSPFGHALNEDTQFTILTLAIAGVWCLLTWWVVTSPFGRVMQACRDNELGVRILGKDPSQVKAWTLAMSGAGAGLAGGVYHHYATFLDPDTFRIVSLLPLLCMGILGGLGSLRGVVVASLS